MGRVNIQRRDGESLLIGEALVTIRIPKGKGRRVLVSVSSPEGLMIHRLEDHIAKPTQAAAAEAGQKSAATPLG